MTWPNCVDSVCSTGASAVTSTVVCDVADLKLEIDLGNLIHLQRQYWTGAPPGNQGFHSDVVRANRKIRKVVVALRVGRGWILGPAFRRT